MGLPSCENLSGGNAVGIGFPFISLMGPVSAPDNVRISIFYIQKYDGYDRIFLIGNKQYAWYSSIGSNN